MHHLLQKIKKSPDIEKLYLQSIESKFQACSAISFVNPYSYQLLRNNESLYKNLDKIYVDGIFSSVVLSKLLKKNIPRVSFDFSSFANTFFFHAEKNNLPIFIVGSEQYQLENAIKQFKKAYPLLNICGSHNGYFEDEAQIIQLIRSSKAQYVICGLGTPKQDLFAQKLKLDLGEQLKQIYTCGGFLHQTQKATQYYPKFIDKVHLRWLYRAYKEPGVAKRLLTKYPLFIYYAIKDSRSN